MIRKNTLSHTFLFLSLFISVTSVAADPLVGKWLCKTHAAEDNFLDIQSDRVTSVMLLEGAEIFERQPSEAGVLVIKGDSTLKLSVKLEQEKLRLTSAKPKLDLQCERLSSRTYKKFTPLPAKDGRSLLDMAVVFRKNFLQDEDVKKNVEGKYIIDRLRVSVLDLALPQSRWPEGREVPRLSTLYKHSWMMWGLEPSGLDKGMSNNFGTEAHPLLTAQVKKWLEAKNILVKDLSLHHCPPTSVANCDKFSRVLLLPIVVGLPMDQIGGYVFMDEFNDFNRQLQEMQSYFKDFELEPQGELKLADTAATIVAQYEQQAARKAKEREQQADMLAQLSERISQSAGDIALLTVVKNRKGESLVRDSAQQICALPFTLKQRAQEALGFDPAFTGWTKKNRSPWTDKNFKSPDDLYLATQQGQCGQWMGPVASMKTLLDAARRDGYEVRIDGFLNEQDLLDSFARRLKLEDYAELQAAEALKASPEQYLVLKQKGLHEGDALKKEWLKEELSQYLRVIGKTASSATVGDYMSYLRDLDSGAKQKQSAAAYRKEEMQRAAREQQEAMERERRRAQARAKVNLSLSVFCYGQDHDGGQSLRTLMDMYASNTHIQAITSYLQSSPFCHLGKERMSFPAKNFVEIYRSGQLVGIRSGESISGTGYLYSFVNYKDWDRD